MLYSDSIHEGNNTSTASVVINLNTLKVATSNFSDEYKLGEGGFGPVYKVLKLNPITLDGCLIFLAFQFVQLIMSSVYESRENCQMGEK